MRGVILSFSGQDGIISSQGNSMLSVWDSGKVINLRSRG